MGIMGRSARWLAKRRRRRTPPAAALRSQVWTAAPWPSASATRFVSVIKERGWMRESPVHDSGFSVARALTRELRLKSELPSSGRRTSGVADLAAGDGEHSEAERHENGPSAPSPNCALLMPLVPLQCWARRRCGRGANDGALEKAPRTAEFWPVQPRWKAACPCSARPG